MEEVKPPLLTALREPKAIALHSYVVESCITGRDFRDMLVDGLLGCAGSFWANLGVCYSSRRYQLDCELRKKGTVDVM